MKKIHYTPQSMEAMRAWSNIFENLSEKGVFFAGWVGRGHENTAVSKFSGHYAFVVIGGSQLLFKGSSLNLSALFLKKMDISPTDGALESNHGLVACVLKLTSSKSKNLGCFFDGGMSLEADRGTRAGECKLDQGRLKWLSDQCGSLTTSNRTSIEMREDFQRTGFDVSATQLVSFRNTELSMGESLESSDVQDRQVKRGDSGALWCCGLFRSRKKGVVNAPFDSVSTTFANP